MEINKNVKTIFKHIFEDGKNKNKRLHNKVNQALRENALC